MKSFFLILLVVESFVAALPTNKAPPTVTISTGVITGLTTTVPGYNNTVDKFLGIPYALPPVGLLRFSPPTPIVSLPKGALTATAWSNACIQHGSSGNITQGEDCLYLNVYSPSHPAPSQGRTVMIWIHGGSLKTGSASNTDYDGGIMAISQDVIVVTINYRLSIFGFSNAPGLRKGQRNAGFYDQRLALQWVQDNIAAFGGDPKKVTIFGESSGATSVSRLIGTMHENPPFRAAITQSGWYDYASVMDFTGDVVGRQAWSTITNQLNCSRSINSEEEELHCMRAASAEVIQASLSSSVTFTPENDDVTQLTNLEKARIEGRIANVPILTGSNANEGTMFQDPNITKLDDFVNIFYSLKPVRDQIASAYPIGDTGFSSQFYSSAAIDTDIEFTCPSSKIAVLTANLEIPTWRYYYNATFSNLGTPELGVYHGAEVSMVFGTFPVTHATTEQFELSRVIRTAWADFAKDPWGRGPGWPKVNCGTRRPGGYAVAALGSPNLNPVGWSVIQNGTIDQHCGIYEEVYVNAAGGVPWW